MPKQIINTEQIISDVAETILSTTTDEELTAVISKFCDRFGIDNYLFGASLFSNLSSTPEIHVSNGYPDEWWDRYIEEDYIKDDLTVAHCKEKCYPIIWPDITKDLSLINKKMFSEASDAGMNAGISLPYHGAGSEFGMFSVTTSDKYHKSSLVNSSTQFVMQTLGAALFDTYKNRTQKDSTNTLTVREKECLKWVAAGKTSWETSVIMGITERTVIFHVQNAASKMNTASRTNAAIIALLNGEISF